MSSAGAFAVAVSLGAITLVPNVVRAQPGVSAPFSCDLRATLSTPSGAKLVVHHPSAEQRRRLAATKPWRFGPFDRSVYGFERIRFYVYGPESSPEGTRFAPADLLVELEGPQPIWLRMVDLGPPPESPQLIVLGGPDGPSGTVRLATPDPALPLFILDAAEEDARSNVGLQYLIDFRRGRPRVPALLECVESVAWGACGTWDGVYGSAQGPIACAWDPDRADFWCRAESRVETPWGHRDATREYPLLSPPEPETVREARVSATLAELARKAGPGSSEARRVDTLGPVHVVARLDRAGGGSFVVLGAAAPSSSFGAQFFLAEAIPDRPVRVRAVSELDPTPRFWIPDDFHRTRVVPAGTPKPGALSFRATTLVGATTGLSVLRVWVREDAHFTDEGALPPEAVYWIGIQDRGTETSVAALRLATNTAEYRRCAGATTPANAARVTLLSRSPFAAELELEPPHLVDLFSEALLLLEGDDRSKAPVPRCPVLVRVAWNDGFELTAPDRPPRCSGGHQPRIVRFTEDGEIVAVAAPKRQEATPR